MLSVHTRVSPARLPWLTSFGRPSTYVDHQQSSWSTYATCVQVYLAALSGIATFGTAKVVFRAFVHVSLILSVVWGVYMYRDVWPSATVDLPMADANEGVFLWVKIGLVSFSGVLIPLLCPRNYVPIYPEVRTGISR